MTPSAKRQVFVPHPNDMEEVRLACEEAERMAHTPITPEKIRESEAFLVWLETGQAPDDLRELFETGSRPCCASQS